MDFYWAIVSATRKQVKQKNCALGGCGVCTNDDDDYYGDATRGFFCDDIVFVCRVFHEEGNKPLTQVYLYEKSERKEKKRASCNKARKEALE